MNALNFFKFAVVIAVAWFAVFQIITPIVRGRPLFPTFRRGGTRDAMARVDTARESVDVAVADMAAADLNVVAHRTAAAAAKRMEDAWQSEGPGPDAPAAADNSRHSDTAATSDTTTEGKTE